LKHDPTEASFQKTDTNSKEKRKIQIKATSVDIQRKKEKVSE